MFDVADHLDGLRCWSTERLVAEREELLREQRRLRVRELAIIRVLDQRGKVDDTMAGRDGVSVRTARESVETARALESLPAVAAAAYAGALSSEQLGSVVALADESTDAGGTDEISNLAVVCTPSGHHQMLVPNGPWALVGNPNQPDGLRLVHIDNVTADDSRQLGPPPRRAGPNAA